MREFKNYYFQGPYGSSSWKNCNQQDLHSQCENLKIIIFKVHMVNYFFWEVTTLTTICSQLVQIHHHLGHWRREVKTLTC